MRPEDELGTSATVLGVHWWETLPWPRHQTPDQEREKNDPQGWNGLEATSSARVNPWQGAPGLCRLISLSIVIITIWMLFITFFIDTIINGRWSQTVKIWLLLRAKTNSEKCARELLFLSNSQKISNFGFKYNSYGDWLVWVEKIIKNTGSWWTGWDVLTATQGFALTGFNDTAFIFLCKINSFSWQF